MTVEVYGDLLCPWCYIGKRRLDVALRGLGPASTAGPEVIRRSYELGAQNRTPAATAAEELSLMWGDEGPRRLARIRRLGEVEGLELNLDRARPVTTFDAHRLMHLAARSGNGYCAPITRRR